VGTRKANDAASGTPLVRRGRRKTSDEGTGARAEIVAAASVEFTDNGYDATSLRAVARRAGVDAALVHHYFADKADLFAATVDVPIRPDRLVAEILRGPRDAIGATIVRTIVTQLDNAPARDAFLALLRTALGQSGVYVRIGHENEIPAMRSLALVATGYGVGARNLGAVSVIGPVRMDYAGAIVTVRAAAHELSRFVEDAYAEH